MRFISGQLRINQFGAAVGLIAFFGILPNFVLAKNICAYIDAGNDKYACISGSEARAVYPEKNSCSQLNECKTKKCEVVDSKYCGSSAHFYACVADNGIYACSPLNKKDCSDVPGCSPEECSKISTSLCGARSERKGGKEGQPTKQVDCDKNPNEQDCLYNPLPADALTDVFLLIVKGFLGIVAVWGVIFIIVGGFRMVMAAGNEEAYTQAKKTIVWAVLGVVAALLSFSIMQIVQNLLHVSIK